MKFSFIKSSMLAFFTFLMAGTAVSQQKDPKNICCYTKTPTGYLMVLRQDDDVIASIERLAQAENIPSASFTGIGFAKEVTFGFYDFNRKKFNPKTFSRVEMGSLTGSVAWNEKGPSVHVHGVATDDQFNAYGGHILSLHVGTGSMEVYVTVNDQKLERKIEQPLNANVLQLNCLQ